MTNERYLIVSYFLDACLCLGVGTFTYAVLRRPLRQVAAVLPWKDLADHLVKLFPIGIVLPALMGFAAVSYRGCNDATYDAIIKNRAYMVEINHKQIWSSIFYVVCAVLIWDAILLVFLIIERHSRTQDR